VRRMRAIASICCSRPKFRALDGSDRSSQICKQLVNVLDRKPPLRTFGGSIRFSHTLRLEEKRAELIGGRSRALARKLRFDLKRRARGHSETIEPLRCARCDQHAHDGPEWWSFAGAVRSRVHDPHSRAGSNVSRAGKCLGHTSSWTSRTASLANSHAGSPPVPVGPTTCRLLEPPSRSLLPALAARQHRDPIEGLQPRTGCAQPSGRCGTLRAAGFRAVVRAIVLGPIPPWGSSRRSIADQSECGGDLERALAHIRLARPPSRVGLHAHRIQKLVGACVPTSTSAPSAKKWYDVQGLAQCDTDVLEHVSSAGTRLRYERSARASSRATACGWRR